MKLINPKVTILFNRDGLHIEVHDEPSGITFLELQLDQKQTCEALSRIGHTSCTGDLRGIENVGKKYVHQNFVFEIPEDLDVPYGEKGWPILAKEAEKTCPEGWQVSSYFGSQGSHFSKDRKSFARTSIFKYVDLTEEDIKKMEAEK